MSTLFNFYGIFLADAQRACIKPVAWSEHLFQQMQPDQKIHWNFYYQARTSNYFYRGLPTFLIFCNNNLSIMDMTNIGIIIRIEQNILKSNRNTSRVRHIGSIRNMKMQMGFCTIPTMS